jgi:lipopolysaccharide export system permease protein
MKILDRYIGIHLARGILLVALVLAVLFSLLELVSELDEVGKGAYRLVDAFGYVALTLPGRMLDLLAVSAFLGSVAAMGLLADARELLAMQALGLSPRRIGLAVLGSGAFLMLGAALVAEFGAPALDMQARTLRAGALSGPDLVVAGQGFWARDGDRLIYARRTLEDGALADVDIYERDTEGRLRGFVQARRAEVEGPGRWRLLDVLRRSISEDGLVAAEHLDVLSWRAEHLRSEQVAMMATPPEALAPSELFHHVRALRGRGENADRYDLVLWQKLSIPFTTGAMILLSLPFVFGSPRSSPVGKRMLLATVVGIGFYLFQQIVGELGFLLDLSAPVTALFPAAVATAAAGWRIAHLS